MIPAKWLVTIYQDELEPITKIVDDSPEEILQTINDDGYFVYIGTLIIPKHQIQRINIVRSNKEDE